MAKFKIINDASDLSPNSYEEHGFIHHRLLNDYYIKLIIS